MNNRIRVTDYEAFGKLIKKWVKGQEPVPKSLDDFKAQAAAHNVGLVVPNNYKGLVVTHRTADVVNLVLPVASMVIDTEVELEQGGAYPLPPFYDDLYQSEPPAMGKQEKLALHAKRIADYTTGQCG